jgi:DNA repair protein RecO (recombination protein O)
MDWSDHGIVLSSRPHGETSAIVELLTRGHGRHLGLVRGGRSRRHRPALQAGNLVKAHWRARLSEHLGTWDLEMVDAHAAVILDDASALAGVSTLCALAHLLPERDPNNALHDAACVILDHIEHGEVWPGLLVRWELGLLDELGFGLDLSQCAKTGSADELVYVSPKSGRAVSREAGQPYAQKMLLLPGFLREADDVEEMPTSAQDVLAGFALSGHFLEMHVFAPRSIPMPEPRGRLISRLQRQADAGGA